jgi:hypothetical protein
MNELKKLTDEELMRSTDEVVKLEKEAVVLTTRHFQEIYRRRAYLPEFSNMIDFLTRRYCYCNGSAQLRIGTLQLIRQVPSAQEKIERGEMSMTVAANIQSFLNAEAKAKRPYSESAKIELVDVCVGKSKLEAQKEFARRNPEFEKRESVRYLSESRVRIDVSISELALKNLNRLRDLFSHATPSMTLGSLIEKLAEEGLDKYCPRKKAERGRQRDMRRSRVSSEINEGAEVNVIVSATSWEQKDAVHPVEPNRKRTRYITAFEKHRVAHDENGCAFIDGKTGRRCGSTKFLQLDHIVPFSEGGSNDADNLRWMCGAHNRFRAKKTPFSSERTRSREVFSPSEATAQVEISRS